MAKTVTCEKCGGTQAIFRDENGGMKCAFCGEKLENLPPYEEGAELGYGEQAEIQTEPQGEPAEAVFTLRRNEVEKALILTSRLKPHMTTSIVETVLLAVLLALQASTVIGGLLHWNDASDPGMMNYFMLLVILILIPAVWIMPRRTNRRIVDRSVSGNELRVRVYENLCEVFIPAEDKSWNFEYATEKYAVSECEEMFLLSLADGRLLALPKRGFSGGAEALARERLVRGSGEMTPLNEKLMKKAAKLDMTAPRQDEPMTCENQAASERDKAISANETAGDRTQGDIFNPVDEAQTSSGESDNKTETKG